jgi:hypothetical protein
MKMSVEHWWNVLKGGNKITEEKPVPVQHYPPQIVHGMTQDQTRTSV